MWHLSADYSAHPSAGRILHLRLALLTRCRLQVTAILYTSNQKWTTNTGLHTVPPFPFFLAFKGYWEILNLVTEIMLVFSFVTTILWCSETILQCEWSAGNKILNCWFSWECAVRGKWVCIKQYVNMWFWTVAAVKSEIANSYPVGWGAWQEDSH